MNRRFIWGAALLGFALGGFFDGILLHQILQWHHLLLGLEGERFRDLRVQMLADGLFHLLMYVIALAGLWMLWTARRYSGAASGRHLLATALMGFGAWHLIDGIVSHWLLGLHRIKMDSPNPLFWDLLWFVVFGVAVVAAGLLLRRRQGASSAHRRFAVSITLAITALAAGYVAALPPADLKSYLVVMRPGADANDLLDGLTTAGGGFIWASRSGRLWLVQTKEPGDGRKLYAHGALLVTASPAALGCLAWTRG